MQNAFSAKSGETLASPARAVVVLVHGTWPRGPWPFSVVRWSDGKKKLWFEDGSDFQNDLSIRLEGKVEVEFKHFQWSGRNTVSARSAAGSALRQELADLIKNHADARLGIIAHSHGAMVALHALFQFQDGDRIRVATLASPFLHIEEQTLSRDERIVRGSGFFGLAVLAMLLIHIFNTGSLLSGIFSYTLIAALAVAGRYLFILGGKKADFLESANTPSSAQRHVLALRVSGDEASLTLGLASLGRRLLNHARVLFSFPAYLLPWILWWFKRSVAVCVIGSFLIFLSAGNTGEINSIDNPVRFWLLVSLLVAGPGVLLVGMTLAVLSGLVELFAATFGGLMLIPFGYELVLFGPVVDAYAEATPPGDHVRVKMLKAASSERVFLRHSIHAYPSVREQLASWIRHDLVQPVSPEHFSYGMR